VVSDAQYYVSKEKSKRLMYAHRMSTELFFLMDSLKQFRDMPHNQLLVSVLARQPWAHPGLCT
jgi:hypothetical protein